MTALTSHLVSQETECEVRQGWAWSAQKIWSSPRRPPPKLKVENTIRWRQGFDKKGWYVESVIYMYLSLCLVKDSKTPFMFRLREFWKIWSSCCDHPRYFQTSASGCSRNSWGDRPISGHSHVTSLADQGDRNSQWSKIRQFLDPMFFFSRIKRFQVLHGDWLAAKGLRVVTFDFQVLIIHVRSSFFICFFTFTLSIADERISILGTGSSRELC